MGWYKNATLFRNEQSAPSGSYRKYKNQSCGYYAKALSVDSYLLPLDERTFLIPRSRGSKVGGFGQTNVWYADNAINKPIVKKVRAYINSPKTYSIVRRQTKWTSCP